MYTIANHDVNIAVDEVNRVIVASITNCKEDIQNYLFQLCNMSLYFPFVTKSIRESILMQNSYKSVAKCAPEDEFNIEVGTKLACERLEKKYYEKRAIRLERAGNWLKDIGDTILLESVKSRTHSYSITPSEIMPDPNPNEEEKMSGT